MPRSLMSTSGWFFSRLSSTNFFRDLDMFCTEGKQSTWAMVGRQGGGRKESCSCHSPVRPGLESGHQRSGCGEEDGTGRGRGLGRGQHHSGHAERQTQVQCHTHSPRRAAPNRGDVERPQDALGWQEMHSRSVQNRHPNKEHALSRCSAQARKGPLSAPRPSSAGHFPN